MNEKLEAASQCIKEGEKPKVLSNEFLKEYFNRLGGKISSNDMVTLRRSLPFIKDWIIPVREEKKVCAAINARWVSSNSMMKNRTTIMN